MKRLGLFLSFISTCAFAGFSIVDGDMPGEYFGNAQHIAFQHALAGDTEITMTDKEFMMQASRGTLASRVFARFRVAPFSRVSYKKFNEINNGVITQINPLTVRDDMFAGMIALGFNFTHHFSMAMEFQEQERLAFSRDATILTVPTRFSGKMKARSYFMNFNYMLSPLSVTLSSSPIHPYVEGGAGYALVHSTVVANSDPSLATTEVSGRTARAGQMTVGFLTRASTNLGLDLSYRVNYFSKAKIARVNNVLIESERVFSHGIHFGAVYHF